MKGSELNLLQRGNQFEKAESPMGVRLFFKLARDFFVTADRYDHSPRPGAVNPDLSVWDMFKQLLRPPFGA